MFATIDIGTNSVLLLIAEVDGDGSVRVALNRATVTRLGEGLSAGGVIADAAAERTLDCLCQYWELCTQHGVRQVAAVGTSTLRTATNAADFLLVVQKALGLEIEVLSAEREAELAYRACARDFGNDVVVIDLGGGSTELIGKDAEGALRSTSLPVGCVSLTEQFLKADPPVEAEIVALRNYLRELLGHKLDPCILSRPHDRHPVATAGTATTLAAMQLKLPEYDPVRVHGQRLSIDDLRDRADALRALPLAERRHLPGLAPERADVILAGAELLGALMSFLGYAVITISDRGLRWGLFYEKFCPHEGEP